MRWVMLIILSAVNQLKKNSEMHICNNVEDLDVDEVLEEP